MASPWGCTAIRWPLAATLVAAVLLLVAPGTWPEARPRALLQLGTRPGFPPSQKPGCLPADPENVDQTSAVHG